MSEYDADANGILPQVTIDMMVDEYPGEPCPLYTNLCELAESHKALKSQYDNAVTAVTYLLKFHEVSELDHPDVKRGKEIIQKKVAELSGAAMTEEELKEASKDLFRKAFDENREAIEDAYVEFVLFGRSSYIWCFENGKMVFKRADNEDQRNLQRIR